MNIFEVLTLLTSLRLANTSAEVTGKEQRRHFVSYYKVKRKYIRKKVLSKAWKGKRDEMLICVLTTSESIYGLKTT